MSEPHQPEGAAAGDPGDAAGAGLSAEQAEVAAALEAAAAVAPPPAGVAEGAGAAVSAAAVGLSGAAAAHLATLSAAADSAGGAGGVGTAGATEGARTAANWAAILFATAAVVALVAWFASGLLDGPAPDEPPIAAPPGDPESVPPATPPAVETVPPTVPTPVPPVVEPEDAPTATDPQGEEFPDPGIPDDPGGPTGPPGTDPGADPTDPSVAVPEPTPQPPASPPAPPPPAPSPPREPSPPPSPRPTATPSPRPTTPPPTAVLHRVNAGGPTLPGTGSTNWRTDRPPSSPWRPEVPDLSVRSTHAGVPVLDDRVPEDTPPTLFATSRHHPGPTDPWQWEFEVPSGDSVVVRLYLADRAAETTDPGDRVFGLLVEDVVVLEQVDLNVAPGHDVATMTAVFVDGDDLDDGILDVDFDRVAGDPVVCGIEILQVESAGGVGGSTPGRGRALGR